MLGKSSADAQVLILQDSVKVTNRKAHVYEQRTMLCVKLTKHIAQKALHSMEKLEACEKLLLKPVKKRKPQAKKKGI